MKSNIVVLACTVDFRIGTLCTKSFNYRNIYFCQETKIFKTINSINKFTYACLNSWKYTRFGLTRFYC